VPNHALFFNQGGLERHTGFYWFNAKRCSSIRFSYRWCLGIYKFVKGRSFQDSLSPIVTARFSSIEGAVYLLSSVQIKNVGSTKIDFNHEGSALIVYEYAQSSESEIHTVAEQRLTAFDVFKPNERYIEPNEIIELNRLIAIPGPIKLGYRLEVEILSKSGFTWTATTVVDKASLRDNTTELIGL
jgi:hypothetical protein